MPPSRPLLPSARSQLQRRANSLGFLPVEPDATLSHTTCAVLRSGRGVEVIASVPLLAANEVPKIRKLRELKKEN